MLPQSGVQRNPRPQDYGLSAAVFTSNLRYAQRFIDSVDTGPGAVNLPTSGWDVRGLQGLRYCLEQGLDGLRLLHAHQGGGDAI
jgi:hypothetical protein